MPDRKTAFWRQTKREIEIRILRYSEWLVRHTERESKREERRECENERQNETEIETKRER